MALVVVTGQVLVTVLLAPPRLVSMTLSDARPEAEEASRHLFASQQNRLHAWRRMGCEKRNVKREMSKELRVNVSAHIFACRRRGKCCSKHLPWQAELIADKGKHILRMPRTFSFLEYGAHEDDGAACMWAHDAWTYSLYVGT